MYTILIGGNNCNNINYLATCHLPPEVSSCKGRFLRWFFNSSSSQCELFILVVAMEIKIYLIGALNEYIDVFGELDIVVIFL